MEMYSAMYQITLYAFILKKHNAISRRSALCLTCSLDRQLSGTVCPRVISAPAAHLAAFLHKTCLYIYYIVFFVLARPGLVN